MKAEQRLESIRELYDRAIYHLAGANNNCLNMDFKCAKHWAKRASITVDALRRAISLAGRDCRRLERMKSRKQ